MLSIAYCFSLHLTFGYPKGIKYDNGMMFIGGNTRFSKRFLCRNMNLQQMRPWSISTEPFPFRGAVNSRICII